MQIFRLAFAIYPVFDGGGAMLRAARWHTPPRRIIYCGPNLSCCRLELMANVGRAVLRRKMQSVVVEVPTGASIRKIMPKDLPPGWDHARDYSLCQPLGDAWFDSKESLLLLVPSVASPGEFNILVNQDHPDFETLKVHQAAEAAWDMRLFNR